MPRATLRRYFRHGLFPQLMVFEAVARLEGVTRAAEELHLAQPTVSTQLKKLSDNLGLALFEQRGRALRLTPAGRELQSACDELMQLFARIEERLAALRAPRPDVLRLAAAPGARHIAARLLAAFCVGHPGVQASLHVANRAELIERLASGEDDLCLIAAPEDRAGLILQPAAIELLHVYAPAGHRLAAARSLRLEALAREEFVLREPGSRTRETFLAAWEACGLRPAARAELASSEAIADAIAAGLGLGFLPQGAARAFVQAGAIVALDVRGFPLQRQWSFARASGRTLSPVAALFLQGTLASAAVHGDPVTIGHWS